MAERVKHWIANMHMQKGALHKELGVPEGQKIPAAKLRKASKAKGKEGRRARVAETLEHLRK